MDHSWLRHAGTDVPCFALLTQPSPCFVAMDEVLEVLPAQGTDAAVLSLDDLGLVGDAALTPRALRFKQAPQGPYLAFCAEFSSLHLPTDGFLELPGALFSRVPYTHLVLAEDEVTGLMLSVSRCLVLRSTGRAKCNGL